MLRNKRTHGRISEKRHCRTANANTLGAQLFHLKLLQSRTQLFTAHYYSHIQEKESRVSYNFMVSEPTHEKKQVTLSP